MKKAIIIVLLLIAAGIGSTFWVGTEIEKQFPEFLQRAAQIGQFKVELTSYTRETFRSTAVTTLTFQGTKTEQVILHHTIWHGPFPASKTRDGQWHFSQAAAIIETTLPTDIKQTGTIGELLALIPDFSKFHDLTTISLTGDATSRITIPPFKQQFVADGNEINFEWGGLLGSRDFDSDLTRFDGDATLSRISISDPSSAGEIKELSTTVQIHQDGGGLLLGNVTVDTELIAFGPKGLPPELSVKGFQLRNAARLEGDFVSYAIEIAADSVDSPIVTFTPVGFELLFSRLEAETILDVQRQLQNLQAEVVDLTENDIIQHVIAIYLEALPALIRKDPEIRLNYLRAQTTDGELWAKGKIILSGDEKTRLNKLEELGKLVQAEGEAQISNSLLLAMTRKTLAARLNSAWQTGQLGDITEADLNEMIDNGSQQQIDDLLAQGVLTSDGKNAKINFSYRDQQATLNGQPFSY